MSKHPRKLKNFLLMPFVQLRLGAIVVGMMALLLAVVLTLTYLFFSELSEILKTFTEVPQNVIQQIRMDLAVLFKSLFVLSIMIFSATIILIIVETHKIVGAAYAINKFIKDNLQNGIYDKKIQLRPGDHLKELAESINVFTEKLNHERDNNKK